MISWRHPHTSWGLSWGLSFTFLLPFLSLLSAVQAQDTLQTSTSPSNNTNDLSQIGPLRFFLESSQLQIRSPIRLAPLTKPLATLSESAFSVGISPSPNDTHGRQPLTSDRVQSYNLGGQLLAVGPSNSGAVNETDIALISCDPSSYPGVLSAGATIANVLQSHPEPAAILLYSAQSDHCNYTVDDPDFTYPTVFTVLGADAARLIQIELSSHSNASFSNIVPDMSSAGNGTLPSGGVGTLNSGSSPNGSGSLAASPTTAVAMIILYSITGIITALFLGIIITGAVRAHRHPERYGPRNVVGRPRQSRARGVARAMLETIPIVKFGDSVDRVDAVKGDVEMASGHEVDGTDGAEARRTSEANENETAHSSELPSDKNPDHAGTETDPAQEAAGAWSHEHSNESGNYVCPICTDDFIKGQDVRVLPCNHQFHPECIDPWLVNVSGTCPLW
jgi:hypothetical protein